MQKILKAITATAIAVMALMPLQNVFAQDLTIKELHVVDGKDGITPVTEPYEGQVMQANIKMSDDSWIYSYPANPDVYYVWYNADTLQILGRESSFTYTSDIAGAKIGLDVEYKVNGHAVTWTSGPNAGPIVVPPAEAPTGEAPVTPQTGDNSFGISAAIESLLESIF